MFLDGLCENELVDDPVFLVDTAPWMQALINRQRLPFQQETHGDQISVVYVWVMVKERNYQIEDFFGCGQTGTLESWLQAPGRLLQCAYRNIPHTRGWLP